MIAWLPVLSLVFLNGYIARMVVEAHSASLRDKKSMKDYERTRNWPRHCATDDGFWEMEAQMGQD